MFISVTNVKEFRAAVSLMGKLINHKPPVPLSNILITAKKLRVTMEGANTETKLCIDISKLVHVKDAGSMLVPVAVAGELLKSCTRAFDIKVKGNRVYFGPVSLKAADVAEFPKAFKGKASKFYDIQDMGASLKSVSYAAGNSETREILNGVFFDLNRREVCAGS
jgi:DNA polymerase III sliding clamp (beta) subunit (PCNA family)